MQSAEAVMRQLAVALAMVASSFGCQRAAQAPAPRPAAVVASSAKDLPASATAADADDDDEIAVEMQESADYGQELRDLQGAEPERFIFNSPEGTQDGVVLGVLAAGETM